MRAGEHDDDPDDEHGRKACHRQGGYDKALASATLGRAGAEWVWGRRVWPLGTAWALRSGQGRAGRLGPQGQERPPAPRVGSDVDGLTRVSRGGTYVPTDVVAVTAWGASVGIVILVGSVTFALVEVTLPALVPVASLVGVAFVALLARARVVVVGLVAVLATARLGFTGTGVVEGRRRAGAFFAVAVVVRLAGARRV